MPNINLVNLPIQEPIDFNSIPGVNSDFSPGFGIIYSFGTGDKVEDHYIIGYSRPNPNAADALQVCISIGGRVDKNKLLIDALVNAVNAKTLNKFPQLTSHISPLSGSQAAVYNDAGEGWDMSYVYIKRHVNISLEKLQESVSAINLAIAAKLQSEPSARLSAFGIYKYTDILAIINKNVSKTEQEKEHTIITDFHINQERKVIVFDDYATQPLLMQQSVAAKPKKPINIDAKITIKNGRYDRIFDNIQKEYPDFELAAYDGQAVYVNSDCYLNEHIPYVAKDPNTGSTEQLERDSEILELFNKYATNSYYLGIEFIGFSHGYSLSDYTLAHAQETAAALRAYKPGKLEILNFAACGIDDAGMLEILGAIVANTELAQSIKILQLQDNAIGKVTLEFIKSKLLPQCPNVLISGLTGQKIGNVNGGYCDYGTDKNIENMPETAQLVREINELCQARFAQSKAKVQSKQTPKLVYLG